ncbi:glycosyltransferase family 2 protein [Bremerella cremea]|uniref:Glycosyltransferase family 2 protein n=1 Tax=Bremerella cremea TaxID=1031537 RepID=A0A368KT72_9BACT|nr:glycosyltransferase family 2 protein [Bremerella cremea]RCS52845.1 glycosyltransferase family 2 protein [Bremerella cremea]
MLKVSIVIPSVNNARRLETTLVSLLENRPSDCEIVVPHCGYYDDPYNIADEVRLVEVPAARTEMELLAVAWSMCRAPIVHTLVAGATVEVGWLDTVLPKFERMEVSAVTPAALFADRDDPVFGVQADTMGVRAAGTASSMQGPMWQAAFYRYSLLEALGGFCTRLEEYADLDIALWIAQAGGVCPVASDCQIEINDPCDLNQVTSPRIRLAKTLQLRHQNWFAAQGKGSGKLGWLSRSVGSGSLATMMSALTAKADMNAAQHRLPNLDEVRAVIAGQGQTFRFEPRPEDQNSAYHRHAA